MNTVSSKKLVLICAILLSSLIFAVSIAASDVVINAEDSIVLADTYNGQFGIATGAAGMSTTPSATIAVTVTGTPVKTMLIWTARGVTGAGDDTVSIDINGSGADSVTANTEWRYTSVCCDDYAVYKAVLDPSDFFSGTNTLTIDDFDANITERHGASLAIISTDSSFLKGVTRHYAGLDGFYWNRAGEFGPNSMVLCEEFITPLAQDAWLNTTFVVGGVSGADRANSIWYLSGTGALPTVVVDAIGATEISTGTTTAFPLNGANNQSADTEYDDLKLVFDVSEGAEWACYQIESRTDVPGSSGMSGVWHGVNSTLEPKDPTAITLQHVGTSSVTGIIIPIAFVVVLLGMGTALYLRQKRVAQ